MKAIIFGAAGQDGRILADLLRTKGVDTVAVSRSSHTHSGDVGDKEFVQRLIESSCPDYVFHFAATSSTRHSLLYDNHNSISAGTINILEAVRLHCPQSRVFLSGSALQFRNEGLPISESTPFEATSAYALARIHSTYAARYFRTQFNLKVFCGYLFNHDSELRTESHVNQKIASAAKRIGAGSTEVLHLGDIDVEKEFNFAGDVVEAIWTIVNQDLNFEVVVGSGKTHSIRDWVQCCFSKIGRDWRQHVVVQTGYRAEYRKLVSDPGLLFSMGWRPTVTFEQLAHRMMESA